jgi:hypothetical protein
VLTEYINDEPRIQSDQSIKKAVGAWTSIGR